MDPYSHLFTATALPGGKIELRLPHLASGEGVEITVRSIDNDWDGCDATDTSAMSHRGVLSSGEAEAFILHEREAWEG